MDPFEIDFDQHIAAIPALLALKNFNAPKLYSKLLIESDEVFEDSLKDMKLLYRNRKCDSCNGRMSIKVSIKSGKHYVNWRCTTMNCRKEIGYESGTWFEGCHLSFKEIFQMSYFWCRQTHDQSEVIFDMQRADGSSVGEHAVVDYKNLFRQVCAWYFTRNKIKIGGPGTIVEIDETVLTKRKYNRGQLRAETQWFFGGVERGTSNCFLVPVERRNSATLLPLIRNHIHPGTTIISDCWSAYGGIEAMGELYEHFTVNHSQNFIDPTTGAHTNTIEGTWAYFKCRHKEEHGTSREMFASYIAQFIWRKKFAGPDSMFHLWSQIAWLYPIFD